MPACLWQNRCETVHLLTLPYTERVTLPGRAPRRRLATQCMMAARRIQARLTAVLPIPG